MRSRGSSDLVPLDLEIERTCRKLRKTKKLVLVSVSVKIWKT